MRKTLLVALWAAVSPELLGAASGASLGDEVPLRPWTAAPYWAPAREAPDVAVTILPFVTLPPCRIVDTRGGAPLGGGPLLASTPRDYVLTGQCGIPAGAAAVSLNVAVTNTGGPGYVSLWPAGTGQPVVATLNYVGSQTIANAAVVPLGAGGAVSVACMNYGCDIVFDTNGYYAPTNVVTGVNALTGEVVLSPGSNVSITPSGNTLTIAATGVVTSVAGTNGISASPATGAVTVTSNATSSDTASAIVSRDAVGSFTARTVTLEGNLVLPSTTATTGQVLLNGTPLLHAYGSANAFGGPHAGNFTLTGSQNAAFGDNALAALGSGYANAAFGNYAGYSLTGGYQNVAVGSAAAYESVGAHDDTAVGAYALFVNVSGNASTAVGSGALRNAVGSYNTAVGQNALFNLSSGDRNIAIGYQAGSGQTGGSDNIFIGKASPYTTASGVIYLGTQGTHTGGTYVAGIYGASVLGNSPVYVDSYGHMGTTAISSRRYKEAITDVGDESGCVLALRPVAFAYRRELDPKGERQYGLIAEEVEEAAPQLVVHDAEGRPAAVRYEQLPILLLNEVQKLRRELDAALARIELLEARAGER